MDAGAIKAQLQPLLQWVSDNKQSLQQASRWPPQQSDLPQSLLPLWKLYEQNKGFLKAAHRSAAHDVQARHQDQISHQQLRPGATGEWGAYVPMLYMAGYGLLPVLSCTYSVLMSSYTCTQGPAQGLLHSTPPCAAPSSHQLRAPSIALWWHLLAHQPLPPAVQPKEGRMQ